MINDKNSNVEVETSDEFDDVERVRSKIAQQLSELSQSDQLPSGFIRGTGSFEAGEVDFSSGNWLIRVAEVQAWLGLNGDLNLGEGAADRIEAAAEELFVQLGDAKLLLESGASFPQMTLRGAEALGSRLDTAASMQQKFFELLENNTKAKATKEWKEAWDDALNQTSEVEGKIRAQSDTWELSQFSYYAEKERLNLTPSYQRGDVWPTSDAQRLIESILRGIPLPSIILLKPTLLGQKDSAKYEVVDGKQRLTSILRFTGQHPEALERVRVADAKYPDQEILHLFQNNYRKFRKIWKRVVGETLNDANETRYYFPFPIRSDAKAVNDEMRGKYYCEIKDSKIEVASGVETIYEIFEKKSQYKVPVIEYLEATSRQIQDVFNLYNKQGKHLNAEEIRNALFHEVDLVRLLLVAAGDNRDLSLAPFLSENAKKSLVEISEALTGYGFGTSRYKRTKMLSWMLSLLFQSAEHNGILSVRSTAKHIDWLFEEIRDNKKHALANERTLERLVEDLTRTIDAHSSIDCWSKLFKDNEKGAKWQELQLVASLVAVFLIAQVSDDVPTVLESRLEEIRTFTDGCRRPTKAQNKTQWAFIGRAALGIVDAAEISVAQIEEKLNAQYGSSCIATLVAAAKNSTE
jgi:Flp pilus assembly pilin Flp